MATTPTTPTEGIQSSLQTSQQQSLMATAAATSTNKTSSQSNNAENSRSSSTNSAANSPGNISNNSNSSDPRHMDAADTLMSLAHSATSTPTVESKPFPPSSSSITSSTLAKLQAQHDLQQQQSEPANIEIVIVIFTHIILYFSYLS